MGKKSKDDAEPKKLTNKVYLKEMRKLQESLCHLQEWDKFKGLRDGRPITVGWMNGRSRPYEVTMPYAAPRTALAIGFNDKCDVVVATVVATDVPAAERAALAFLNGDLVRRWVEKELGL